MARGRDARGADDVEPEVALFSHMRLAGVHAHPHTYLLPVRPLVSVERTLRIDRRGHRVARAGEREEERVALCVSISVPPRAPNVSRTSRRWSPETRP